MSTTGPDTTRIVRVLRALEVPLIAAVPVAMVGAVALGLRSPAPLLMGVALTALAVFFAGFEVSRPALRQIMPTVVLAALAAAGRILFAPVPDFKPVSAIAVIAGAALGPRSGFMVGSLAALSSNFFFGQGMWTPWQMYAWGLVGYLGGIAGRAGVLARADGRPRRAALIVMGFASAAVYAAVINAYDIIGFVQPLTFAGIAARLAAAAPFDIMHGLATAVFLVALFGPWTRRIGHVVRRYGL